MFPFFTDDDSEIGFVGRFIFGETDVLIETKGRIFDFKLSDALIQFIGLFYQLLGEIEKIISFQMISVSIAIHPFQVIILFDCLEESKGYFANH
jgi:hypothetical protein